MSVLQRWYKNLRIEILIKLRVFDSLRAVSSDVVSLKPPFTVGTWWWNVRLSVPFGDTSLIHVKTPVILTHTLLLYHWYKCTHSEKGSKHNNELSVPWKGLEDLYFRSLTPKYMDHTVRATDLIQSLHFMRKRSWKRPTQDSPIS